VLVVYNKKLSENRTVKRFVTPRHLPGLKDATYSKCGPYTIYLHQLITVTGGNICVLFSQLVKNPKVFLFG